MKHTAILIFFGILSAVPLADIQAAVLVGFESLPVNAQGYYNGDTSAGSPYRDNYTVVGTGSSYGSPVSLQEWTAGGVTFGNQFTPAWGSWSGWSWSNVQDNATAGWANQYASFPGGGAGPGGLTDPGGRYAIGFGGGYFNLPSGAELESLYFSNTTYVGLAARDGNDGSGYVSGAFGSMQGSLSPSGDDFLRVTFTGYDQAAGSGNAIGSITRYLADYRSDKSDNPDAALFGGSDYVLDQWAEADFSSLSGARSITFAIEGSDVGPFGLNTPAYLAIDNLTLSAHSVPEPGTLVLLGSLSIGMLVRRARTSRTSKAGAA